MAAIDELMELVPPPANARRLDIDWQGVENDLDSPLPADYKSLVEAYGRGSFGDFMYVLQPRDKNKYLDLRLGHRAAVDALRGYAASEYTDPVPYEIEEGAEQVLTWGGTDNGDRCYWVVDDPDPGKWNVAVNEAGPEWNVYYGNLTEFLLAVLSRKYRCPIFPDGFPSRRPTFRTI